MQKKREVAAAASSGTTMEFSSNSTEEARSDSFWTPESDVEFGERIQHARINPSHVSEVIHHQGRAANPMISNLQMVDGMKEEMDWFMDLNLEGIQGSMATLGSTSEADVSNQHYCSTSTMLPFWN